eukprot:TRINITY_DN4728_c0_g1_i2.p2 TRINITY_DN4728_c0_g1~~TRINITY_DN4728_c0_g1_i2.p2  ORF type:complete len:163 (+),score=42.72 TRINITY_DN4728_c0_g1_i2:895-1383(+)
MPLRPPLVLSVCGRFVCVEPPHPTHHATAHFSRAVVTKDGVVSVSGTGAGHCGDAACSPRRGGAADETRWALENVAHVLEYCRTDWRGVFKVTMLISDKTFYNDCNAAYVDFLQKSNVAHLPMRTCALWGVPTDMKVGFACEAYLSDESAAALFERARAASA